MRTTTTRDAQPCADPNVWGDVRRLDSPDTRSTVTGYDPAGNPLQHIDARGVTLTQTYDALNRHTTSLTPDTQQSYRYDQGTNGKGLLTGLEDSSGSQSYVYTKRRQIRPQKPLPAGGAVKL